MTCIAIARAIRFTSIGSRSWERMRRRWSLPRWSFSNIKTASDPSQEAVKGADAPTDARALISLARAVSNVPFASPADL